MLYILIPSRILQTIEAVMNCKPSAPRRQSTDATHRTGTPIRREAGAVRPFCVQEDS